MPRITEFLQLHSKVLTGILLAHIVSALLYMLPKWVFSRSLPVRPMYLAYSLIWPFFFLMELMRPPKWRRKWLERSGVKEVTVEAIVTVNHITNPDLIRVDQVLIIPTPAP